MADLYEILGLDHDAQPDEIKRAYRRRARESHPDAGGDEETFKQVTHAYQVLADPQRRARYDRFGDDGTPSTRGAGDPFGGAGGAGFGGIGDVIDAFFGTTFGGATGTAGGAARTQPGRDVLVPVELTLADVVAGVQRGIDVEVADTCDVCGGSGSESGAARTGCGDCGGSGQVQRVVRTAFGQLATASACPTCGGTGRTVDDPCRACGGDGRRVQRRTVTVDVPAGVDDGDRLRVSGAGEAGAYGAPPGDLYVEVRLARHEHYERDGRELWGDVHVPFAQAALGADLTVPTLEGDAAHVELPPGSQPGDVVTVKRAGLPMRGGGPRGPLRLRVHVTVPTDLDPEQRELVARLAELRGEDVAAGGDGLLSRLADGWRRAREPGDALR